MRIRAGMLAAGAAALISAQAAYAAPASALPTVDPLVSLSVFGTAQSRAAVCAAGSAAAMAGAAAAAVQTPPPGCLLPITGAPPPVATTVGPPPPVLTTAPGKGIGALPLVFGLLALLGLGALLFLDDDDDLDPEPVSPF